MSDRCDDIQKKLVKLHLTRLPVTDDPEVQAHLANCPTCRIYRDHLDHDHQELEGYAESLDSYVDNVKEKLHRHIEEDHPEEKRTTPFPWWAVAAIIPLAAVCFLFLPREPASPPPNQNTGIQRAIPNPTAKAIAMELELARQHLDQGNIAALHELLDSQYDETRVQ
ncbi:MAG: hypothetical protein MI922_13005, partial [Bacteroidales bacterium]|nr:hypothetical protein [Bacteroidales bacterium]